MITANRLIKIVLRNKEDPCGELFEMLTPFSVSTDVGLLDLNQADLTIDVVHLSTGEMHPLLKMVERGIQRDWNLFSMKIGTTDTVYLHCRVEPNPYIKSGDKMSFLERLQKWTLDTNGNS